MDHSVQARSATIAVVDDDVTILDAMQLLLESHQWAARVYETGKAFLADLAQLTHPDCVILDPHLHGMSGYDVLQAMPNGKSYIPIIGLTARPASALTLSMVNDGVHMMLTKPVAAQTLVDHIRAAIGHDHASSDLLINHDNSYD